MSDRRPARARKIVDYTKFGDPDNFDDDFADLTPPPAKKQKTGKEAQKKGGEVKDKKKSTKRAPLSEKVYERELQEALELSLLDSQGSTPIDVEDDDDDFKPKTNKKAVSTKVDKVKPETEKNPNKNEILCVVDVIEKKTSKPEDREVDRQNEGKKDEKVTEDESEIKNLTDVKDASHKVLCEIQHNKTDGNDSDGIVVLDNEEEQTTGRGGRRRSASKVKVILDDSDDDDGSEFGVEDDDDSSDDDYDEENDSDFDCGSKKKKAPANKKAAPAKQTKQTKTTKTASKTNSVTPKPATGLKTTKSGCSKPSIKSALSSPAVVPRPAVKSPACRPNISSPVVRSVPKWNPPGAAGNTSSPSSAMCIKSPSSGMRVGLSRNQRVKSLHPGLTVKNA